ncbi:MAG: hypothetical protein HY814_05520 [Candidatus Riflebacteria bacterium]|nr:hypothetical protein [Candidatus Riflebacteria bacterium]
MSILNAIDANGHPNLAPTNDTFVIDTTGPRVTLDVPDLATPGPLGLTATFNEPILGTPKLAISGPGAADNRPATSLIPTADPLVWLYSTTLAGTIDGAYVVSLSNCTDLAGNPASIAGKDRFLIDHSSLTVSVSSLPPVVSRNQNVAGVQVIVRNTGPTGLDHLKSSLTFSPSDAGVSATLQSGPGEQTAVAPGATATFLYTLSVSSIPALGPVTAVVRAQANNSVMGNTLPWVTLSPGPIVTVQAPAALAITKIESPRSWVTGGLRAAPVWMTVANTGGVTAQLTGASLSFKNGLTDLTSGQTVRAAAGNPTVVSGGRSVVLSFAVDLATSLPASTRIVVDAAATGVDTIAGTALSARGAAQPLWWSTTVPSGVPVAVPGPDQTVAGFVTVTVDGRASVNPELTESLTYSWTFASVPAGSLLDASAISPNNSPQAAVATFQPDVHGTYALSLVVSVGTLTSTAAGTKVNNVRAAPVARIVAPKIAPNLPVTLDGSTSSSAEYAQLTYHWSVLSGPTDFTLTPNDSPKASHTQLRVSADTDAVIGLVVDDGTMSSPMTTATVSFQFGRIQRAILAPRDGDVVSTDADPVSPGQQVQIWVHDVLSLVPIYYVKDTQSGQRAQCGRDYPAVLTLAPGQHSVSFGDGWSVWSSVTFTVVPAGPNSVATVDVTTGGPRELQLDASRSSVAGCSSGAALTYEWTLLRKPPGASAFTSTLAKPKYRATAMGDYGFSLEVTDPCGGTAMSVVLASVLHLPPVADAGRDRTIILARPDQPNRADAVGSVTLDGTGSSQANGFPLTYHWSIASQPALPAGVADTPATLTATGSAISGASFSQRTRAVLGVTPLNSAGTYKFKLTVSDPTLSADSVVTINAIDPANLPPVANAGPSGTVDIVVNTDGSIASTIPDPTVIPAYDASFAALNIRNYVRLDGRGSSDPNGRALTYRWSLVSRPSAASTTSTTFDGLSTPTPSFASKHAGDYVFGLTVNNGVLDSEVSTVKFTIRTQESSSRQDRWFAQDLATTGRAEGYGSTLQTVVGHAIVLDASLSRGFSSLSWRQSDGPSVNLRAIGDGAKATFTPAAAGNLTFEFNCRYGWTSSSYGSAVHVNVFPAATTTKASKPYDAKTAASPLAAGAASGLPGLSVLSTASTTTATGREMQADPPLAPTGALHVTLQPAVPTTVNMQALLSWPGAAPSQPFRFDWAQLEGPTVLLSRYVDPLVTTRQSVAQFNPTTPFAYLFSVAATPATSELAGASPPSASARVRVVVSSQDLPIPDPRPVAAPATFLESLSVNAEPQVITLDGTDLPQARALAPRGQQLRYQWRLVAGDPARVTIASPNAPRTQAAISAAAGGGCGGSSALAQTFTFAYTIDVFPAGVRSETVGATVQKGGVDPGSIPVEAAGLRLFLANGTPVSQVTTQVTFPLVFKPVQMPSGVTDGTTLTLGVVDFDGNLVSSLRSNVLRLSDSGPMEIVSPQAGDLRLSSLSPGRLVTATYSLSAADLAAMGYPSAPGGTGAVSFGAGPGGGGGCQVTPVVLRTWPNGVMHLAPVLFLFYLRRRGRRTTAK